MFQNTTPAQDSSLHSTLEGRTSGWKTSLGNSSSWKGGAAGEPCQKRASQHMASILDFTLKGTRPSENTPEQASCTLYTDFLGSCGVCGTGSWHWVTPSCGGASGGPGGPPHTVMDFYWIWNVQWKGIFLNYFHTIPVIVNLFKATSTTQTEMYFNQENE